MATVAAAFVSIPTWTVAFMNIPTVSVTGLNIPILTVTIMNILNLDYYSYEYADHFCCSNKHLFRSLLLKL